MNLKQIVKKGDTSRIEYIWIRDANWAGITALSHLSSGLSAYYVRTQGTSTSIGLVSQTVTGAYSSGGFVQIDSANMPGLYRLDIPDACFATGADKVIVMLKGATNMIPVVIEYQLVDFDPEDSTRLGLVALPNAQPQSSGGLVTFGTGVGQLNVSSGIAAANLNQIDGQATNGYNATLKLKQLDIQNSAGTAFIAKSTGGDGHGAELTGAGDGHGLKATVTGTGIAIGAFSGTSGAAGIVSLCESDGAVALLLSSMGTGGLAASVAAAGPAAVDISGAIGIRIDASTVGINVLGTGNSTPVKLTRAGTGKDFHLAGDGLITGGLSGAVNSVTTAVALPTGNDVYHADIALDIDTSADEYTVAWFKNGEPVAGTSPKIYAVNRGGSTLIAANTDMLAVSGTNYFKYDASGAERLPAGETAIVEVKATIGGATRTFVREIPRNS